MRLNERELKVIITDVFTPNSMQKVNRTVRTINNLLHPVLKELGKIKQKNISDREKAKEYLRLAAQLPDAFDLNGSLKMMAPGMSVYGNQYIDEKLVKMTFFATYMGADEDMINMLVDGYSNSLNSSNDEKSYYRRICIKARQKFLNSIAENKLFTN